MNVAVDVVVVDVVDAEEDFVAVELVPLHYVVLRAIKIEMTPNNVDTDASSDAVVAAAVADNDADDVDGIVDAAAAVVVVATDVIGRLVELANALDVEMK